MSSGDSRVANRVQLPFPLFSTMWAIVHLFHLVSTGWWRRELDSFPNGFAAFPELALVVLALLLLINPRSLRWLIALALGEIINTVIDLPYTTNHTLVAAFVNLTIIMGYLTNRPKSYEDLIDLCSPVLRTLTLIIYFFATFHKLNSGFVTPGESCATIFYGHITSIYSFFPRDNWAQYLTIYGTLLIEGGLFISLLFPATRLYAAGFGIIFHFILALDVEKHFFDFSSTMFALLSLFLSRSSNQEISCWHRISDIFYTKGGTIRIILACLFAIVALSVILLYMPPGLLIFRTLRPIIWLSYGLTIILLFFVAASNKPLQTEILLASSKNRVLYLVACLFFINGIAPYLGLKNRSSLDMYSNLKIENGVSNHFLIRKTLQLFGDEPRGIQIHSSSDEYLEDEFVAKDFKMPYYELKSYLIEHPDISIRFEDHGNLTTLSKASDSPQLVAKQNPIIRKLVWFRPIDANPGSRCIW